MKEVKAFQCDFCDKVYLLKSSASSHQSRCHKNPKNKSCASCLFFSENIHEYGFFLYLSSFTTPCIIKKTNGGLVTKCEHHVPYFHIENEEVVKILSDADEKGDITQEHLFLININDL